MRYQESEYVDRLEKLHSLKLQQANKAKESQSTLLYMVYRAEADAIDQELRALTNPH